MTEAHPALEQLHADSLEWARMTPAGWASHTSQGRWKVASHLAVIQRYLFALINDEFDNLIVSMPPRHGKSSFITTAFPGWYLGNFPDNNVIITSYEATLAAHFGRAVRDMMDEYGQSVFGLSVRSDSRAAADWHLRGMNHTGQPATGGLRATGVGGGLTGRGGDLIIVDDPIKDAKQAQSDLYRATVWDWYLSVLFSRREPNAKQIIVMTRWHEDDLVGRLLDPSRSDEVDGQKWVVLNLPAIAEEEGDVLGRKVGDALWPERWPLDELRVARGTQTAYWWGALYQGRPAPATGNIFKRSWWRFWEPAGANLGPVRIRINDDEEIARDPVPLPAFQDTASSWDLTFKKGSGTAFVAGQKWGKKDGSAYLLDQTRARRDFPETVAAFQRFHEQHSDITAKWVEDKANGPALIALLRDQIPGIIPVQPEGSKENRARGVAYYAESGNVYLPHPAVAPWVWEFIEEHSAFPNAMYNDQVDTTSQALTKLFEREHKPSMIWGRRYATVPGVGR
jgi:predicted phage terminase large subunit-like protein